jgi:hypothetical protein
MEKNKNSIMKSALVALAVLLLLITGTSAVNSATSFFSVTFNNGLNQTVTLDASQPTGTLLAGSMIAMNFTFLDTANSTNFYNISFSSTNPGLTLPVSTSYTTNLSGTLANATDRNSYFNVSTTNTVLANTQTFINITGIVIPLVTNNSANNTLTITVTTGQTGGIGYGSATGPVTITYKFDIVNNVNSGTSTLTAVSTKAVANNTDKFQMNLIARDVNGNVINGATFNLVSNRTQDTITPSSVTTDATGNATFNVTSTLAGLAKITANGTNLGGNLTNSNVVFIAGPANKLAFFGANSAAGTTATTPGTTTQTIAVQDTFGNNVTSVTSATLITLSKTGSATFPNGNTLPITNANIDNTINRVNGIDTTGVFNSNFVVNDTAVETVTIGASPNATFSAISKNIQFFGPVSKLVVTLSKSALFANTSDTLTATAQLQDAANNSITTAGISVTLTANNASLLTVYSTNPNTTDVNGATTFIVKANGIEGSTFLTAIDTSGNNGNSQTITLAQAPSLTNSVVSNNTNGVIQTGGNSTITATINDYNSVPISGQAVTFNLTTGDATFTDGTKLKTVNTASNGNASVAVTSFNASTSISVNVTIVNETGAIKQITGSGSFDPQTFSVIPGPAAKFVILPGRNIGLTNVNGTQKIITINLTDSVGNLNTTAGGTINITASNTALGNMSNGTTTVNNNLTVTISGGNASFTYTVNSSIAGTTVLTLTSSLGINDTITITTSGAKGIALALNKKTQQVGDTVLASAQLVDASGNALGIIGTNINFVVTNATNVIQSVSTNVTNANGIATFNFTQSVAGVYTVTASNGTLINRTTVTFAGPAASIVVTVNNTSPLVNQMVTINATVEDANGVTSGSLGTGTIWFLADGIQFATATITNGEANTTYTQATTGAVTITAFYNVSLQGSKIVNFTSTQDILAYYRGLTGSPSVVDTADLLQAADDWSNNVTVSGFSQPITTQQLLTLANEWSSS